jgi:hypothetical protein
VSNYFTVLKGLWDELINYQPLPPCSCGSVKILTDYREHEYISRFLMGLNESFSHIRGQILLLDPMPPINKVFSLVLQEERQRQIVPLVSSLNHNTAAMMITTPQNQSSGSKTIFIRKDRPKCTHCGVLGHTIDKCYRIHGFPPGFKFNKGKNVPTVNQVSEAGVPHLPFTYEQYEKLISLINPKSGEDIPSVHTVASQDPLFADMAGRKITHFDSMSLDSKHSVFSTSSSVNYVSHIKSTNLWIIDTGATDHMVCSISCLTSITSTVTKSVRLPNGNFASVTHIGTV